VPTVWNMSTQVLTNTQSNTQSNTLTTVVANTIVRAQPAFLNANLYTTPHTPQIS
jgi:hypothetical protein